MPDVADLAVLFAERIVMPVADRIHIKIGSGKDQAGVLTSPFRLWSGDAFWLVPFAGATGVALHYDAQAQQELGIDKCRIDTSNTISNFGSPYAAFVGASGFYFLGLATHNEHLPQTGRLGAEAIADARSLQKR
jgi:hypothetical protein